MSRFEIPVGAEIRMAEIPGGVHPLSPPARICLCCPDCGELSPDRGAEAGCRTCAVRSVVRA